MRQSVSGGGAEREGDTESEAGSRLLASGQRKAWCGAWTHKLWDHDPNWSRTLNWLNHPHAPSNMFFKIENSHLNLDFWLSLKLVRSVAQSFYFCTTLSENRGALAAGHIHSSACVSHLYKALEFESYFYESSNYQQSGSATYQQSGPRHII